VQLFLVEHPNLPKRIQVVAETAESACHKLYYEMLSERLRGSTTLTDCTAVLAERQPERLRSRGD